MTMYSNQLIKMKKVIKEAQKIDTIQINEVEEYIKDNQKAIVVCYNKDKVGILTRDDYLRGYYTFKCMDDGIAIGNGWCQNTSLVEVLSINMEIAIFDDYIQFAKWILKNYA